MPITALPDPPSRSSPSTFATKADAFLGALPTFATEANALQADVNSKQTAAATSATNAANSEAASSASATNSANSAAAAAASATASANSATAAANTYDMFDDRFLGAKASDPAVDNDGNALQVGAAYFNTTNNTTRLWNGSTWQVAFGNISGNFTVVRETKVATAGQTVFNLTNSYITGTNSIMVYLNGVRLLPGDYTETNSTTVTLSTGAALNDDLLFEIGVVSVGTTAQAGLTSFNPTAGISATNVQAALAELDAEKATSTDITNAITTERTASATLSNKTLDAPIINNGYTEETYSVSTSGTVALSLTNGSIQVFTLTGNITFTDSLSSGQSLLLGITPGANTVTWSSTTWSKVGGSGTAPTLTSTGVNWVVLWKINSTLRGAFLGTA